MTKLINIFMLAGEEISQLSSSTQILIFIISIGAAFFSIKDAIQSYKSLKSQTKENRKKNKILEQILNQKIKQNFQEYRLANPQSNVNEDSYQHKIIKFK